jgi:hypothetical protein
MSELDRYLDDLGRRLDQAQPPRSRRLTIGLGAAVALALAIVAVVFASSPGGERRPLNAIAEARAALAPDGQILYIRIRFDIPATAAGSANVTEQWSTDHPLRWRFVQHTLNGGQEERAYGAGVLSTFYADDDLLVRQEGYVDHDPSVRPASIFGQRGGDPDTDLQAMLAAGKLVDRGEQRVDGRTVRRLESRDAHDPMALRTVVYDVDPKTFAPVGGAFTYFRPGHVFVDTIRFRVERYERLPITKANARLLTVTPNRSTAVIVLTAAEVKRRFLAYRRWRERCVHEHSHARVCRTPPTIVPTPTPTPHP